MQATRMALAMVIVLSACGGSDAVPAGLDSPAITTITATATTSATTVPVAVVPETVPPTATAPPESAPPTFAPSAGSVEHTMTELLGRLPLEVFSMGETGEGTSITVTLGDFLAAGEMAGAPRPDSADGEMLLDWMVELTTGSPVADGGSGFAFVAAEFPERSALGAYDEFETEFGFSPFAIDAFASYWTGTSDVVVVTGDIDLAPDLIDLGGGIVSAGDGDDYATDFEERTAARPLGRPRRLAHAGEFVATSLSTPVLEAWLSEQGASLSAEPRLAALASTLDVAGTVNAQLFVGDFALSPDRESTTPGLSVPFEAVGVGIAEMNGMPISTVVYAFADDSEAAAAIEEITRVWTDGQISTASMFDYFPDVSVEQVGSTVLVRATISDRSTTHQAFQMLFRQEPAFTFAR